MRTITPKSVVSFLFLSTLCCCCSWLSADLVVNVKDHGAKGDTVLLVNVAITAGQNVLTCASANFVNTDQNKIIVVMDAGASTDLGVQFGTRAAPLFATIASVTDAHTVVLDQNAQTTVTPGTTITDPFDINFSDGKRAYYGTDDTAAIQASATLAKANAGMVFFPAGGYLTDTLAGPTYIAQGMTFQGVGAESSILYAAKSTTLNLFEVTGAANYNRLTFRNLCLTGPGQWNNTTRGIWFHDMNLPPAQCLFENMELCFFGREGIYAGGVTNAGDYVNTGGEFVNELFLVNFKKIRSRYCGGDHLRFDSLGPNNSFDGCDPEWPHGNGSYDVPALGMLAGLNASGLTSPPAAYAKKPYSYRETVGYASGDHYSLTVGGSLTTGRCFIFRNTLGDGSGTNTGNSGPSTMSINGGANIAITYADGSALQAGAIARNAEDVTIVYDGTKFILCSIVLQPASQGSLNMKELVRPQRYGIRVDGGYVKIHDCGGTDNPDPTASPGFQGSLFASGCPVVTVEECDFESFSGIGCLLQGPQLASIRNSYFIGLGRTVVDTALLTIGTSTENASQPGIVLLENNRFGVPSSTYGWYQKQAVHDFGGRVVLIGQTFGYTGANPNTGQTIDTVLFKGFNNAPNYPQALGRITSPSTEIGPNQVASGATSTPLRISSLELTRSSQLAVGEMVHKPVKLWQEAINADVAPRGSMRWPINSGDYGGQNSYGSWGAYYAIEGSSQGNPTKTAKYGPVIEVPGYEAQGVGGGANVTPQPDIHWCYLYLASGTTITINNPTISSGNAPPIVDGQHLRLRIRCTAGAGQTLTITFGDQFSSRAFTVRAIPNNETDYFDFIYDDHAFDTNAPKWELVNYSKQS